MSSAVFFHREMKLFFDHYVKVGEESVFGRIGKYYGAVETNERGRFMFTACSGCTERASQLDACRHPREDQAAYRERIVRYIDSVFSEDLDQESFAPCKRAICDGRSGGHSMVNRWNEAIAVGLRHNHDISFIATQRKTMALIYYVTNYATKVEDPVWKRVAAAAELLAASTGDGTANGGRDGGGDAATDDPVEVVAHLLGYPAEFTDSSAWAYLNCSLLYWEVFRRWRHLRASGAAATDDTLDESVVVEEEGLRISRRGVPAPGELLKGLCLYDYISIVRLKRIGNDEAGRLGRCLSRMDGRRDDAGFRCSGGRASATACLDGYLSKDFTYDDESCYRRAAVQHLALFVPWESFLGEGTASSGDGDPTVARRGGGAGEAGAESAATYQPNSIGDATRLIDVVRGAVGANQVTAKSPELMAMIQQLCRFQQSALRSTAELEATALIERGERRLSMPGGGFFGGALPPPGQGKAIKSQQGSASKEGSDDRFREDEVEMTMADDETAIDAGREWTFSLAHQPPPRGGQGVGNTADAEQEAVHRFSDNMPPARFDAADRRGDACQLRHKEPFDRLLITATSGTAAARINGITIHSACGFTKDQGRGANMVKDLDGVRLPKQAERFIHGQSRMDWQEKDVLVIDEFRPVKRSIVLPSAAISWDVDNSFKAEQRHQHDKAHALWKRFTTVVMLDEQMRAAGDPELQRLLKRIRLGVQDRI
ncbi:PIF1 protein [Hirsutella rhossiliensis]|uniref:PIF1 protein n=1 Tax=Hirsutella rhossiliensis TaxID=111463 RepID=A0A9P8ML77_9HYPO|nr:PIF1 protein [Hirsutella rhossiliensis]KAH0957022.1 PIF1 protein [Hirsutella rhossiliensis]